MCNEGLLMLRLEGATTGQRSRAEGVEEDLGRLWKTLRKDLRVLGSNGRHDIELSAMTF